VMKMYHPIIGINNLQLIDQYQALYRNPKFDIYNIEQLSKDHGEYEHQKAAGRLFLDKVRKYFIDEFHILIYRLSSEE